MELRELIERVEGATSTKWGDCHDLNRDLMTAYGYEQERRHIGCECWDYGEDDRCCEGAKHIDFVWVDPKREGRPFVLMGLAHDFVGDVGRALQEVGRMLPGALYELKALPGRLGHGASLWSCDADAERMLSRADAPTAAQALVSATLRALQATRSEEGE